jgi:hypothetical protein
MSQVRSKGAVVTAARAVGRTPLPPDIEARRIRLEAAFESVSQHGKIMDGLLFGYVGADAVISLVPVAGDLLSGLTTFWLLAKAREVKMPLSDRFVILGLGVADVLVGMVPFVGDAADLFFRAHEWNSRRVQAHIVEHLQQIEFARGAAGHGAAALGPLRDQLFRGGRTKAQVWTQLGVSLALCAGLLAYCSHEADLRHERIVACERAGGWLCSWRN